MTSDTMREIAGRMGRAVVILIALALMAGWIAISVRAEPAWSGQPERTNTGEVSFVVTPRGVTDGRFRVDVAVNTHSGDLARLDLQAATELRVDGRALQPLKPVALRGHHARGRLEFALDRVPERFEIVIRGIRTMGDVTFRWP